MKLELLLDFDVIADFALVLLELLLVLRAQPSHPGRAHLRQLIIVTDLSLSLFLVLSHGHQDLDRGLDILNHGEWVYFPQLLALFR